MRAYKILRLLPLEGGEKRYRIKTITESLDRIANESEITLGLAACCPSLGHVLRYREH